MKPLIYTVLATFLLALLPDTTANNLSGDSGYCESVIVGNIGGLINAGTVSACIKYPALVYNSVADFRVQVSVFSPLITSASINIQFVAGSNDGCSPGATSGDLQDSTLPSSIMSSRAIVARWIMTADSCSASYLIRLQGGVIPTTILETYLAFSVQSLTAHGTTTVSDDPGGWMVNGVNMTTTIGAMNITFPTELAIQLCGPDFIATGICTPVEIRGEGTVDQSGDIAILFPLILFALLILWAEIKGDFVLYILAIVVGGAVVVGLWPDLAGMRFALVAVITFLAWRAWMARKDPENLM